MKHNKIFSLLGFLGALMFLWGCKKAVQDPHPAIRVDYTVTINEFQVTFTNTTAGAKSFKWDFGDGTTSTETSPTHTYAGKGKFVVTLFATATNGKVEEGSTVLHISKTSPVKLDDGTFSDWDNVSTVVWTSQDPTNTIKFAKFDYDATSVYFYVESTRTLADDDILDIYLDADGASTGYDLSGYFPGAGIEALIEGQLLDPTAPWGDLYYYTGDGSSWSWSAVSIPGAYVIGTKKQDGAIFKFEGKFDRTKIAKMTGKAMKLGIVFTKNDWSAEVGYLPDINTPPIFIDMSE
ncbi:MAG: PKD domain-containing protein [Chitinophagaceae bacterium]|nr:PKD domain-containing protein [Chitinophagaceae bacterium]